VLTAALTYVDSAGAGSPGTGGTGTGTPGTGTGTDIGTGGSGGTGTGGTGTGSGGSGSGSGGSTGPVVTAGPGGERLVRTTKFAALGAIWSMDCSTSCSGVAI
jgi:serine protease